MLEALLPLGSVVRLGESDFLAVIIGFYPDDGERMYDYIAAPYPFGLSHSDAVLFLDGEAVAEVIAPGYSDELGQEVLEATVEMMNAQEEAFVIVGEELEKAGLIEGLPNVDPEDSSVPEGESEAPIRGFNMA